MLTQINHADKLKVQLAVLHGLKFLNIEETDLQFNGLKYTLIRTISKLCNQALLFPNSHWLYIKIFNRNLCVGNISHTVNWMYYDIY